MAKKLLILPGDGIGVEVMAQVRRIVDWMAKRRDVQFEVQEGLIGGAAYDAFGTPLADETLADALAADAVLLGAVGGPKWDDLPFDKKPERGLLKIRKEMGLFANLRPAVVFDALVEASTLKNEVVQGLDIMIVRELTGGLYFGEPRGIETLPDGQRKGVNTLTYTTSEIQRIGRVAFELARKRNKKVCSVDKANVLECTVLWREEMIKLQQAEYPDVELSHMYVDNASMQLVRNPKQFDVMLTDNMFGDILSELLAIPQGGMGTLTSASLGDSAPGIFEPVHGSAPDIAGRGIANPAAMIGSVGLMFELGFEAPAVATRIRLAVEAAEARVPTPDLGGNATTHAFVDAVVEELTAEPFSGVSAAT